MKSRQTAAKTVDSLDVRGLLDLMAWAAAQDEMEGARPGEVYQAHFHKALRHAHLYQPGDGHIHGGWEKCLGAAVELERTQVQHGLPGGSSTRERVSKESNR